MISFHCCAWRPLRPRAGEPQRQEHQIELTKPHKHSCYSAGCTSPWQPWSRMHRAGYPRAGRRLRDHTDPVPHSSHAFADTTPLIWALAKASILHSSSSPSQAQAGRTAVRWWEAREAEVRGWVIVQHQNPVISPRVFGNAEGNKSRGQASAVSPSTAPCSPSIDPNPI